MDSIDNTFTAYLGGEFQKSLIWQLLVSPEFAEKTIPDLGIEYFDNPDIKRLFIVILEYYKEFEKVPNLQNKSIHQAINKYTSVDNDVEREVLFGHIKNIENWNQRVINKEMHYNGDVIQKSTTGFIKQQEYRKLSEFIGDKVRNGQIKDKYVVNVIEERFQKISRIGEEGDDSESLIEGVTQALRKEFRETIPTGIGAIDALTGGGLGKGEIGLILTPSGVGKTTALTIIANTAYELEKNVAQIIFEDTKDQVKRKHYTIWSKSALSKLNDDDENKRVTDIVLNKAKELEGKGRLIIKRFSQEDTTIKDVRNWMVSYEKKWGFKFDILILDYLDCLESHKKTQDRNESELTIVKGFEALSADFDIPAWSAIQSNRTGFGSEFVEAHQSGGSIKRIQKAHFFMSVAKTPEQQEANLANIRIIKARFAKDGQSFEDCIFNNNTMEIIINDPRYQNSYKKLKHYDETDIDKLELKSSKMSKIDTVIGSNYGESASIDKLNNADINNLLVMNNTEHFEKNENIEIIPSPTEIVKTDETVDTSIIIDSSDEVINDDDIELNDVFNINPDIDNDNSIKEMLVKKRSFQHVIKK